MGFGKFITFEGGEGTGKTTQIQLLYDFLTKQGYDVVVTREPGGTEISEQIRNIILNKDNIKMDFKTEAYLFCASRNQHLKEKIIPALEQGKIVLCDRYIHSSYVYQGLTCNNFAFIYKLNKRFLEPDLTIYFDMLPENGLKRISENGRKTNRLDEKKLDYHNKVREGYKLLLGDFPYMEEINAEQTIEQIQDDIKTIIKRVL